jgi:hypothetical protein
MKPQVLFWGQVRGQAGIALGACKARLENCPAITADTSQEKMARKPLRRICKQVSTESWEFEGGMGFCRELRESHPLIRYCLTGSFKNTMGEKFEKKLAVLKNGRNSFQSSLRPLYPHNWRTNTRVFPCPH